MSRLSDIEKLKDIFLNGEHVEIECRTLHPHLYCTVPTLLDPHLGLQLPDHSLNYQISSKYNGSTGNKVDIDACAHAKATDLITTEHNHNLQSQDSEASCHIDMLVMEMTQEPSAPDSISSVDTIDTDLGDLPNSPDIVDSPPRKRRAFDFAELQPQGSESDDWAEIARFVSADLAN